MTIKTVSAESKLPPTDLEVRVTQLTSIGCLIASPTLLLTAHRFVEKFGKEYDKTIQLFSGYTFADYTKLIPTAMYVASAATLALGIFMYRQYKREARENLEYWAKVDEETSQMFEKAGLDFINK